MPVNSNADTALTRGMTLAASLWAEKAKEKAKTGRIKQMMTVGQVVNDGGGRYHIDITNSAPEAAAYEFGSGLHGRLKSKYPIVGKNRPDGNLIFFWQRKGRVFVGPQVMHPGVKAEPFMKPALEENKGEMAKLIGQAFSVEVVYKSIREMWNAK